MDKESVEYYSAIKKGSPAMYSMVDLGDIILYDLTFMWDLKKSNSQKQKAD